MCCYSYPIATHTLPNCKKVKYMPISHFDDRLLFNHSKARETSRFYLCIGFIGLLAQCRHHYRFNGVHAILCLIKYDGVWRFNHFIGHFTAL